MCLPFTTPPDARTGIIDDDDDDDDIVVIILFAWDASAMAEFPNSRRRP